MKIKTPLPTLLSLVVAALVVQVDAATDPASGSSSETTGDDNVQVNTSPDPSVEKQIEWFKSQKGSFFSPKIIYGKLGDGTSFSGMYAIAPIAKGEEIIHVPVEQFITADMGSDTDRSNNVKCDTAWNLAEERRKGKSSHWEPFVNYCFETFPQEHLPANWSDEAMELFDDIIDEELEPQNFGDTGSYEEECGYDEDEEQDEILEAAYRIVTSRGWSGVLLPMVDMINHRNGKWYNADQAGSAHIGKDISFVALRDIEVGEQIYDSYNECPDTDCAGIRLTFTTPQILAEFGFVEQYPRRFNVAVGGDAPVFELDMNEDDEVELTWLNGEPDDEDLEWFSSELERLEELEEEIYERLQDLESHEQYTITTYYQALIEAFELASSWEDKDVYKALEDHVDPLDHTFDVCPRRYKVPGKEVSNEGFQSIFQNIEFRDYNDAHGNKNDTCVWLDNWVHMCNSLRPHYHEWFVHHPAQFLKQVKRVLFLGGGDNMILHEVLKYPELEFVIGMELDQGVVRGSFKHFKIQPHFDGKAEWWFGDAAKSLRMLPDEYLGTFDLVVVDLLTYVVESLMVTDELNILDFSMLLLNEGGILTMNEDFIVPTKGANSKYSVDLEIMDVPVFCQQSVSMLSNTVDFVNAEPIDHGVESIVVKPGVTRSDSQKFNSWWNYKRNDLHQIKERKASKVDASDNTQGVLMVLEAEDASLSIDSIANLYDAIAKSLEKVGLTVLSSSSFEETALMIALKEGYVMLRSWFEHQYFAFDLVLWSNRDKLGSTKAALVTAVGAKSTSSYNIVTGGMRGVETVKLPKYPADINYDDTTCPSDASSTKDFDLSDLDGILQEMTALTQSADPVTIVFCPEREKSCHSLKALENNNALPVWACASGDSTNREIACESATLDVMKSAASQGKIDGIVIDPKAPRKMGQVLKKVLSTPKTQKQILAQQYIVLAPALDSSESWRTALLEWFRTDVAQINPDNHAEVLFSSSTCSGNLRMSIFSAGDKDFYSHLVKVTEKCERINGLLAEINSVQGGKHAFMDDFEPTIVATESSYDKSPADNQWASQTPLGMQTLIQFETEIPFAPLRVGEKVMGNFDTHPLTGKWYPATIKTINKDGTFDLVYLSVEGDLETNVPRNSIRKWDIASEFAVSEPVLAIRELDSDWYMGKVVEKLPDNEYRVHIYESTGLIETKGLHQMMKRFEKPGELPPPEVSCAMLKEMLEKGVASIDPEGETKLKIHDGAGNGCVATALWTQGNAVANWDGGHHIDLNMFTFEENQQTHKTFSEAFIGMTSSFSIVSHNEQPRGLGRVVNFKHEMKTTS